MLPKSLADTVRKFAGEEQLRRDGGAEVLQSNSAELELIGQGGCLRAVLSRVVWHRSDRSLDRYAEQTVEMAVCNDSVGVLWDA